jgi:energy-coupling factor transport system permease protein
VPGPGRGALTLGPVPASLALAGVGVAALLFDRPAAIGAACALLLAVVLRAPPSRRRPYLVGAVGSGASVLVLSPFLASEGFRVLWTGPVVPVLGALDVTREELVIAAVNGGRLAAVALAFSAYALLVDHDRLLGALGFARRSALTAVLATRLVPTLERDAAALREAVRGRGVPVHGVRGHARLVSPLVAGSLERALNLAEAMEARGFGRPGRTRLPQLPWTRLDRGAVAAALVLVAGAVWL